MCAKELYQNGMEIVSPRNLTSYSNSQTRTQQSTSTVKIVNWRTISENYT